MKRKTGYLISGLAAVCLLTAVFIGGWGSRPADVLNVSVKNADARNLPRMTETTVHSQNTTASETTVMGILIRDLNLAAPEDLMRVEGIGETLALEIVTYRTVLGGYTRRSQLSEIRGIGDMLTDRIMQEFEIIGELPEETTVTTITAETTTVTETVRETTVMSAKTEKAPPVPKDLNQISREELLAIPEMTEERADKILEMREHTGRIGSVYALVLLDGFTDEWVFRELVRYLYVEDDTFSQDIRDSAAG